MIAAVVSAVECLVFAVLSTSLACGVRDAIVKRAYSLRREDFQRVWDNGKSWSHPLVILRARPNDAAARRFAFVAGKKTGKAVHRNRAKRLLRESVRRRLETISSGWDIILISRAGSVDARWSEVDAAVASVLLRAHLVHST